MYLKGFADIFLLNVHFEIEKMRFLLDCKKLRSIQFQKKC